MGRHIQIYISAVDEAKIALLREHMKQNYTMNVEKLDDSDIIMAVFDIHCMRTFGEVNVEIISVGLEMKA